MPHIFVACAPYFCGMCPEMGVYRDNLLPIIVIAQNGLDVLITDIAFEIYFVIVDKLSQQKDSLCTQCSNFKVSKLAL